MHEMVFGFMPAVIAGFLFTAIPNWTDRPPIRGKELMLLVSVWLAGRLVIAMPGVPPLSAVVDGAFLVVVTGLVWREIAAGESWSHSPIGGLIGLYAGANILFHVLALTAPKRIFPHAWLSRWSWCCWRSSVGASRQTSPANFWFSGKDRPACAFSD